MKRKNLKIDKKAVSIMIGYVLLITAAVVMSLIVYAYIKTYVPKDIPKCPDGVSLMIMDVGCQEGGGGKILKLQLKNNGLFSVDGYFIRATKPNQELATVDLSSGAGGFEPFNPPLEPGKEEAEARGLFIPQDSGVGDVFSIEITPMRVQTDEENKKRSVTCGNARIREKEIICGLATP